MPVVAPPPPSELPVQTSAPPPLHPASLLPPVLTRAGVLGWLWVLPVAVLLLLNLQGYALIEGNLDAAQRMRAYGLGAANAVNLALGLGLWWLAWRQAASGRTPFIAQRLGGLPLIAAQVSYLWFVVAEGTRILPASVPAWIYPEGRLLFNQFAFAMLPLFLGVLQLAGAPAAVGSRTIFKALAAALAGPCVLYVAGHFLGAHATLRSLPALVVAGLLVLCGLALFAGLVRALLLGLSSLRRAGNRAGERAAIVIFALALPLAGLVLNAGIPFPVSFQAWEVYALVVLNAAVLVLASYQARARPQLTVCLLAGTFPFSLYFFIVFLPYTPLSVLAVLFFGAGFLVLTPTILFTLHLHLLHQAASDAQGGRAEWRRRLLRGGACALLLPGWFVVRAWQDRVALHAALDHVHAPVVAAAGMYYRGDEPALRRALASHRAYKEGIHYPLLSDFYSWAVFDGLVLPDDKLARVEELFFGASDATKQGGPLRRPDRARRRLAPARPVPRTVSLADLRVSTSPAGTAATTITLRLELRNDGAEQAEFAQVLPLPPGVFVHGFRLHINGQPVPGRITEKKTALWVYTMIRDTERRDPGLLFYRGPDELELRVFPVAARGTAVVEIDFLAPGAHESSDGWQGARTPAAVLEAIRRGLKPALGASAGVAAGLAGSALPLVEREPYLHVIVDRSERSGFAGDLAVALDELRRQFPAVKRGRVSAANYEVVPMVASLTPLADLARTAPGYARTLPRRGGFATDLALAHALRQHVELDLEGGDRDALPPRPIVVILSADPVPRGDLPAVVTAWEDLVPVLPWHELGASGKFVTLHGDAGAALPLLRLGASRRPLRADRITRFGAGADAGAALEYWSPVDAAWRPVADVPRVAATEPWARAAALQARAQDQARSPGAAPDERRDLVLASRRTGVMLPLTSYIVVENAAQWRMLEASEQRKLGQNDALQFVETPAPPAVWIAGGFLAWGAWRRRRQRTVRSTS